MSFCSVFSIFRSVAGTRAIRLRERLIKKGLVREEKLATGQSGRPSTVLVPTDQARDLFASQGPTQKED